MKKYWKWVVVLIVLLLIGGAAARIVAARKAQAATALVTKPEPVIELAASDVYTLQAIDLAQGLPISGSLRAASTAVVKARVSGELQGLTLREGDMVKAGQVVARVDAAEYQARVTQAQRSADAAKAQIDIAQRAFDNNKALVNQGFISSTALDTSAANLEAAKSTHASSIAAVQIARKSLDDTVLKAPITGVVSQRLAQPGERVGIEAKVIEIVDDTRLELEAQISPADSVDVRVGQSAQLTIEGRKDAVAATVVRINPSAQAASRSVLVYLALGTTPGLRQGLFAQGTLGTARVQSLAVPLSAVRSDKPTPYVQVIESGAVVHRNVELGAKADAAGTAMVAINNIAAGAQLTLASAGFLREGTKVSTAGGKTAAKPGGAAADATVPTASAPMAAASAAN